MKNITFTWFRCKYKYTPYITFEKKKMYLHFLFIIIIVGIKAQNDMLALGLEPLSGNTKLSKEK